MVTVSDCYGRYTSKCTVKFYKPDSMMGQLGYKFAFVDEYNRTIPARYAEKIETI